MRIGIIGGGASGLFCGLVAKKNNPKNKIYIIEKADKCGKKILATGNGRCNLTNETMGEEFFFSSSIDHVKEALSVFTNIDTKESFNELGLLFTTGDKGKIYPRSLQASSVLDVLRIENQKLGVNEITGFKVLKIEKKGNIFRVFGEKETLEFEKIVIATGGKSGENLGSDGDGYTFLKSFGHKMNPVFQSLVQIKCDNTYTKALNGTKITVSAKIEVNGKCIDKGVDEMHFTEYGLSGPLGFNLSRSVSKHFSEKNPKDIYCSIDFMGELSYDEVKSFIIDRIKAQGHKNLEDFFTGVFSKRCGQMIIKKSTDKKFNTLAKELSGAEIKEIANNIKAFKVKLLSVMPFKNSQVTAGGIKVEEFDIKTLESKNISGLYACGEVLDVDGICGGYNLQWAWSSGYMVGKAL